MRIVASGEDFRAGGGHDGAAAGEADFAAVAVSGENEASPGSDVQDGVRLVEKDESRRIALDVDQGTIRLSVEGIVEAHDTDALNLDLFVHKEAERGALHGFDHPLGGFAGVVVVPEDGEAGTGGVGKPGEGGHDIGKAVFAGVIDEIAGENDKVGLGLEGEADRPLGDGPFRGVVYVDVGKVGHAKAVGTPAGEMQSVAAEAKLVIDDSGGDPGARETETADDEATAADAALIAFHALCNFRWGLAGSALRSETQSGSSRADGDAPRLPQKVRAREQPLTFLLTRLCLRVIAYESLTCPKRLPSGFPSKGNPTPS